MSTLTRKFSLQKFVLPITYSFLLLFYSALTCFSQQSKFEVSFTSNNVVYPPGEYKQPMNLRIKVQRHAADKQVIEIFLLKIDEKNKRVTMLVPAKAAEEKYSIRSIDSIKQIELGPLPDVNDDSTTYLLLVGRGYQSLYYTLKDLAQNTTSEYSWLKEKRESLFKSLMRFTRTDLAALPPLDTLHELLALKSENVQEVEPDLKFIVDLMNAGLQFKQLINVNEYKRKNESVYNYQFINPPSLQVALQWKGITGYVMNRGEKSPLDERIETAAEKNRQLVSSRGVSVRASDYLKFTLRELVATLEQWPNKMGLLLYSMDSTGLHIMYADNSRKVDTVVTGLKENRLNELAQELRSLLVTGGNESRGLGTAATTRPGTVDSMSRIISQYLLPAKFNLEKLDHLVIIPVFNIGAFPFGMLPVKDSLMLIDKMSYSIIPSINEFIITGQIRKKHLEEDKRKYKQIMDSSFWTVDNTVLFVGATGENKVSGIEFAALPGAKKEIELLSKMVPSPVLLIGKDAIKSNVKSSVNNADIIYFATHAIADPEDPLNKSFILLSGKDDAAMLTAKEIQLLDLEASMVILSACETGLGKSHAGGMIGLSRAFQLAGAKNVLMSLWPVSDNKTPTLMKYFFEALASNGDEQVYFPHEAFRAAVLRFKKEEKNPAYWAAFSFFGIPN